MTLFRITPLLGITLAVTASIVSAEVGAGAPQLAQFCAETAAEAPWACAAAIAACLAAWGIEFAIDNTPADQRAAWVNGFLDNAIANSPGLNYMVIATYYNTPEHASGIGQIIGDCGHTHQEISISGDWGTSQGFEVYTVGANSNCCIEKWGDGGYSNWGYYGNWKQTTTASGSLMNCINAQPPTPPPAPPAPLIGSQRYQLVRDLVLVNGVLGRLLSEGEHLYSFNSKNSLFKWQNSDEGPYYQALVQEDGNVVVYHYDEGSTNRKPVWWTNTGGKVNDPNWQLVVQNDGNLVLYRSDALGNLGQAVWNSGSSGIYIPDNGYVGLSMQQDGNMVLYAFYPDGSCDPIWGSFNQAPIGVKFHWPH